MTKHSAVSFLLFATICSNPVSVAGEHLWICLNYHGSSTRFLFTDFNVSLDLQWDYCSDQLTLTCTHSEAQTDPSWVYNGTTADGVSLDNIRQSTLNLLQPDMLQLSVEWTMWGLWTASPISVCTTDWINIKVRNNVVQYYWGKLTLSCTLERTSIYACKCCHVREVPCSTTSHC